MPFDPDFIPGHHVPLPTLAPHVAQTAFDNGRPIEHTRFSVVFNQQRGFAVYGAHNIDGASLIPEGDIRRRNRFRLDPQVPNQFQVDDDRGYRGNPWDRGHLVRRRSLHWGNRADAEQADEESFFWTNITPQHEQLHDTAWGQIEDWMLEWADEVNRQAAVFTGPVLTPEDPEIVNRSGEEAVQIPAGFWKIMAIRSAGALHAAGFLVWQRDFDKPDPVQFEPFLEQVRVTTLEYLTGLSFDVLREADPLRFGEPPVRGARSPAAPTTTRPTSVRSPKDLFLPGAYRRR